MTNISGEAYARLRKLILDGAFPTDEPLSERALAERLSIGRTPVREAIKALTRDGLITVVPGRGTFLKQVSLDEIREIYEVRLGIEGIAAYLAAERGGTPELHAFEPIFRRHLQNPEEDVATIQAVGADFHVALVAASGNRRLTAMFDSISNEIQLSLRLTRTYDQGRVYPTALAEHIEILDAIKARDPEGAQRAVYKNLSNALAARVRIFHRFGPADLDPPPNAGPLRS